MDAVKGAKRDTGRTIMDAQPIGGKSDAIDGGGSGTADAETRMLQARLDILVGRLSAAVWINPGLTLLWMMPFLGFFPRLGTVTLSQFFIIMAMQISISIGAVVIDRGYARDPSDSVRWLKRVALYQASTGVGWGIFAWLIWSDGNLLNNVLV